MDLCIPIAPRLARLYKKIKLAYLVYSVNICNRGIRPIIVARVGVGVPIPLTSVPGVFAEPLQNICQIYSVTVRAQIDRTIC